MHGSVTHLARLGEGATRNRRSGAEEALNFIHIYSTVRQCWYAADGDEK